MKTRFPNILGAMSCGILFWLAGTANGQSLDDSADQDWPSSIPKRISLRFEPVSSFSNNAQAWWSLQQGLGRVAALAGDAGLDRHASGRLAQFFSLAYFNLSIGHYSHELGHNIHSRNWSIDATDWSLWPWPRFFHGDCEKGYCDSDEERLQSTGAGLNVEEYDAYWMYRQSLTSMSFDESMAFAFRKLSSITYDLYTGRVFGLYPSGDVTRYKSQLRKQGISVSSSSFVLQAGLSNILTYRLWEAVVGNWNYLRKGVRENAARTWSLGHWSVIPPLVNWYLTPRGGFYDVTVFAKPAYPGMWEWHWGWDGDVFGGGKVNRFRLGAGHIFMHRLDDRNFATWTPFLYLTFRRSGMSPVGGCLGADAQAPLTSRLSLTGSTQFSREDVLEQTVKWLPSGFYSRLGFSLRI